MAKEREEPAMQVIVLGSGGGPLENNTTAFLVRSLAGGLQKGSVLAVDAGVHLSAIVKIVENYLPDFRGADADGMLTVTDGPFRGLKSPFKSAKAIALHITTELIGTYLITHPHLDHTAGFVINTAAIQNPKKPKRLAGLPSTIDAFKAHIFNNVIWPNLTDEGGAGLVTFARLIEGGPSAMGEGDSKGYQEICEGLSVKTWVVSHGNCASNHQHLGGFPPFPSGSSTAQTDQLLSPGLKHQAEVFRRVSGPVSHSRERQNDYFSLIQSESPVSQVFDPSCVVDSSVYFIRDIDTGKEVVIFGDVEPDSVSLTPRNGIVWSKLAPIFAAGRLGAILIECSYDDSVAEDRLYGHLAPRYLIAELKAFVEAIEAYRQDMEQKDQKGWNMDGYGMPPLNRRPQIPTSSSPVSPLSKHPVRFSDVNTNIEHPSRDENNTERERRQTRNKPVLPLRGLKIVVIHLKDRLDDGRPIGDLVSEQLNAYEKTENLGCEFIFPEPGEALYF